MTIQEEPDLSEGLCPYMVMKGWENMTPIGLEAFKKNEATYLGDMPSDHDPPLVEVVQEGVSFPQPSEKETQAAVEELMNELNGMVDQATQTPPPQFTLTGVYDSPKEFAEAKRQMPPPPAKDGVVISGFDKYHLILRVLLSCFKPPTVITLLALSLVRLLRLEV